VGVIVSAMEYNFSILQKVTEARVYNYPFPHIIIHDALPADLASLLTNTFPMTHLVDGLNNSRVDISASASAQTKYGTEWRQFIEFHTSQNFFHEIINAFGELLLKQNPNHFHSLDELYKLKVGTRNIAYPNKIDISLDAQISINTPVQSASSVRKIHIDNANKLFSGMLYLRQPLDQSIGGNLNLCSWKEKYTLKDKLKFYRENLDESFVEIIKTVEYKNNVCILFLNSIDALHSVTPREVTHHPRTFINFVGELPYDIFSHHNFLRGKSYKFLEILRKLKRKI
jgi:hypothetical protein